MMIDLLEVIAILLCIFFGVCRVCTMFEKLGTHEPGGRK